MAQLKWYQKASVQTAMVTGIIAIIIVSIQMLSGKNQLQDRVVVLEDQLDVKDSEIRRLETSLVPFQTMALDRYPGELANAMSRFAEDLNLIRNTLDQSLGIVRSLEIEITITVAADWVSGMPPEISGFLSFGGSADTHLNLSSVSGELVNVDFYSVGAPTVVPIDENSSIVKYRASARAGNWPIGSDYRDILGCEGGRVIMYGIDSSFVEKGVLGQLSLNLQIFVNGVKQWTVSPKTTTGLDISNSKGHTPIKFRGHYQFHRPKKDNP